MHHQKKVILATVPLRDSQDQNIGAERTAFDVDMIHRDMLWSGKQVGVSLGSTIK